MRLLANHGSITLSIPTLWSLVLSATLSSASPSNERTSNAPRTPTRPYSVLMAESIVNRGNGLGHNAANQPVISYEHGTFQHALWNLYTQTKNETYLSWIKKGIDTIVTPAGGVIGGYTVSKYALDDIRVGESMIHLWTITREEKYKTAAGVLQKQMASQPRTKEGAFWHKAQYPQQQWLDGIYMALPTYALYAATIEPTNKDKVFTDVGKQFELVWQHCRDSKTGLLRHGYDYSKQASWADPVTGASPEVWDRAVGWYLMALVDFLTPPLTIPSNHPTYALLLTQLKTLIPALLSSADPRTGGWYIVVSQPGSRQGNYVETSGTAMFIYSMLKAVRLGLVNDSDGKIVAAARKAYDYLVREQVVWQADGGMSLKGTVSVGSLNQDGSFAYYTGVGTALNDLKGTAAFVLASLEYEH